MRLRTPLATVFGHAFSVRDLLLLAGGLFLVWKATGKFASMSTRTRRAARRRSAPPLGVGSALVQIVMLDIVFSVDSIITAVGMTTSFRSWSSRWSSRSA